MQSYRMKFGFCFYPVGIQNNNVMDWHIPIIFSVVTERYIVLVGAHAQLGKHKIVQWYMLSLFAVLDSAAGKSVLSKHTPDSLGRWAA